MQKRVIISKNYAVAGVIEALLLVALVSIVISTIQLVYIPQIMEQREAEHMDDVSNQFSTLKSMIDLQAITQSEAPISSLITLGSRELPYFITAKAFGEVLIEDSDDWNINIDYGAFKYDLTSITFIAYNSYFVDQTYALEGGGILVKQTDGKSVMRADPSIAVVNGSDIDIKFNLPIFISYPSKNSTFGYGKCVIRTNYSEGDADLITINFT